MGLQSWTWLSNLACTHAHAQPSYRLELSSLYMQSHDPRYLSLLSPHVPGEGDFRSDNRCYSSLHCCCCCLVSHVRLCDPMDFSTPGFPVLHHLPELAQTHVHWVSDAIQPSHRLSFPSPPAWFKTGWQTAPCVCWMNRWLWRGYAVIWLRGAPSGILQLFTGLRASEESSQLLVQSHWNWNKKTKGDGRQDDWKIIRAF